MCRALGANLGAKVKLTAIFLEMPPCFEKETIAGCIYRHPSAKAGLQSA